MALFKKNKNKKISILSYIKAFFKEIYLTISYASIGLFKIFDFIINVLVQIFSYIFYGFKYLGEFTVWIGNTVYNYFLKYITREIYYLFKAIYLGITYILKLIFYLIPYYIFNILSSFFAKITKSIKVTKERILYFFKHSPSTIKDYFLNKWNNLTIVKHYRNKKERELEVLFIDKNGKDAERSVRKRIFEYLARNKDGKLIKGYFGALSKLDVHSYLLDNGFEVYEIKTNWWINFVHGESKFISIRIPQKKLVYWLAQLSTFLKAGIPLVDAIKILSQQDSRRYKKIYDSIIYELSMGESFSEALRKQNNAFPGLLINMIKAAELIGDLEGTLDEMSRYYDEKEITRKQMIGALTYPSIILILTIVVVTFMVMYIVPQFKRVYDSMNAQMTGITLFLLNMGDFLKDNFSYLVIIVISILFLIVLLYKKVKAFRTIVQYLYMHLPVIGNMVIYNEMNLFAKTFAVLNKNNVLLTDSIDILSKITSNEFYKMLMYDTISNLLRGDKISASFKNNWVVPQLAYYMISTGEQTGELSTMLEKVSEYYQREQRTLTNTLKTVIEPILMIFLAAIVGVIMISLLLPMYSIGGEILKS